MSIDTTSPPIATMADLLSQLGDIPPSRVLLHPAPGTATEEDVLRWEGRADKRLCELIDGVLVEKAMGFFESLLASYLIAKLHAFVKEHRLGVVLSSDAFMWIVPTQIRVPDASYFSWDRLPGRKLPKVQVPHLSPDIAIEVLSPSNTKREMEIKRANYFEGGTLECWEVLIPSREVVVYYHDREPVRFSSDATLTTPLLPGFALVIANLFAELDQAGP